MKDEELLAGVWGPSVDALEVKDAAEATPRESLGLCETSGRGEGSNSLWVGGGGGSWMSTGCCFLDLDAKPITAARLNLEDLDEAAKALEEAGVGFVTEVMKEGLDIPDLV